MDFESVEVMSTLDVTGVSKSLEQAAAKVNTVTTFGELTRLWSHLLTAAVSRLLNNNNA